MTPAKFPDDDVATIRESITDVYWVVASFNVVFPVFFVFGHDRGGVRGRVRPSVRHFVECISIYLSNGTGLITLVVDSSVSWAEFIEISKKKGGIVTRSLMKTDPVLAGISVGRRLAFEGIGLGLRPYESGGEIARPGRSANAVHAAHSSCSEPSFFFFLVSFSLLHLNG